MGVLLLLATGIFALSSASLDMTLEIHDFEEVELKRERFIELCRMTLDQLPANARIQLEPGILTLKDAPLSFGYGVPLATEVSRVVLSNVPDGAGYYTVRANYLNVEEADEMDRGGVGETFLPPLPLLRDVRQLRWRVWYEQEAIWVDEWFEPTNPTMVELTLAFVGDEAPTRAVFRVPARGIPTRFSGAPVPEDQTEPQPQPEVPQ